MRFAKEQPEQFASVPNLRGRKRPYFSKNKNELRTPSAIDGTDIYIETNLSAVAIDKLARQLVTSFGYGAEELKIEIE